LRTKTLFATVEPEIKALVEKVAQALGISQSDYVRFVVLRDLQKQGYLERKASLGQAVPVKNEGEVT
jgi:CTP-dependent riboflavin kinase